MIVIYYLHVLAGAQIILLFIKATSESSLTFFFVKKKVSKKETLLGEPRFP